MQRFKSLSIEKQILLLLVGGTAVGIGLLYFYIKVVFAGWINLSLAVVQIFGIGGLVLGLLVAAHAWWIWHVFAPIRRLRGQEEVDPQEGREALDRLIRAPRLISLPSLATWPVGLYAVTLLVDATSDLFLSSPQKALIGFSGLLLGVLIFAAHRSVFESWIQPEIRNLLERIRGFWDQDIGAMPNRLQVHLIMSSILIVIIPLFFMLLLTYVRITDLFSHELARNLTHQMGILSRTLEGTDDELDLAHDMAVLSRLELPEGVELFYLDQNRKIIFPPEATESLPDELLNILYDPTKYADGETAGRSLENHTVQTELLITQPGRPPALDFMGGARDTWRVAGFQELKNNGRIIAVASVSRFQKQLTDFWQDLVFAGLVILGMVFVIVRYNTNNITDPMRMVSQALSRFAQGDLSAPISYYSDTETGYLARSAVAMRNNLGRMIGAVNRAAAALDDSKRLVEQSSTELLERSKEQASLLEESSSTITEIHTAMDRIIENTGGLVSTAGESSSSITEMTATIKQVSGVTDDLSKLVNGINEAIGEMADSTKKIDENIANLFDLTEMTSSAMIQIDSSLIEVRDNVGETERVAEQLLQDATEGRRSTRATREGIINIQRAGNEATEAINDLKDKAQKIGKILSVINEIVDQTNLLSLNAAIIAAQAGEHGKGFAVVASEIKELAKRTFSSTEEISQIIKEVQQRAFGAVEAVRTSNENIAQGAELSQQSEEALEKIVDGVQKTSEWMRVISTATAEQSRGGKEVSQSIEKMVVMTDEIANATKVQDAKNDSIRDESKNIAEITSQVRNSAKEQTQSSALISGHIERVAEMARFMNESLREQRAGSERVYEAVSQVAQRAREHLDVAMNLQEVLTSLTDQTARLQEEVSQFKV